MNAKRAYDLLKKRGSEDFPSLFSLPVERVMGWIDGQISLQGKDFSIENLEGPAAVLESDLEHENLLMGAKRKRKRRKI